MRTRRPAPSAAAALDADAVAADLAALADLDDRREHIGFACANVRLEGLEPSPWALALADRYVAGEITISEFVDAVRAGHGPGDTP